MPKNNYNKNSSNQCFYFFYAGFVRFRMGNESGDAPTVANTVEIMQQQQNVSFDEFLTAFIFNEFLSYKNF